MITEDTVLPEPQYIVYCHNLETGENSSIKEETYIAYVKCLRDLEDENWNILAEVSLPNKGKIALAVYCFTKYSPSVI